MALHESRTRAILDVAEGADSVLDIGCVGEGIPPDSSLWLHGRLCDVAKNVSGIDIQAGDIAELQTQGYDVKYGNAEDFELDDQFDVIVAGEVIEHLSNPGLFLDRCQRHLKSGGKLIISTPNPWAAVIVRRAIFGDPNPNPEHTCWFGLSTLTELLSRHGFNVFEIIRTKPDRIGITWLAWKLNLGYVGVGNFVVVAEVRAESGGDGE